MKEALKPAGNRTLIFRGERYECENYKECWFKYCELVVAVWGQTFNHEVFNQVLNHGTLMWHFKREPNNSGGREFRLINGIDIYVDCNLIFDTIKVNMKTMNCLFGCKGTIE